MKSLVVPCYALLFVVAAAMSMPAKAQGVCYETIAGPDVVQCNGARTPGSDSADFTGNCQMVKGPDIVVEAPCPARWVNVSNSALGHAQACNAEGLSPAFISGQMCASGEKRPSVGTDVSLINYRYGKWGNNVKIGGNHTTVRNYDVLVGGNNNESCFDCSNHSYSVHYCWKASDIKDYDMTDLVVAYACE